MTDQFRILEPDEGLLTEVAALRWESDRTSGGTAELDREDFIREFVGWLLERHETHLCLVALSPQGEVVGMGFLALQDRTPATTALRRRSAEVQTVFVTPDSRGQGLGTRLSSGLVELARREGALHVTVHSSREALAMYERAGFRTNPGILGNQLPALE